MHLVIAYECHLSNKWRPAVIGKDVHRLHEALIVKVVAMNMLQIYKQRTL